jgi:hypothetical protein
LTGRASTEHNQFGRLDPTMFGKCVDVVEIEKQPPSNFVERQASFRDETPKPPVCEPRPLL